MSPNDSPLLSNLDKTAAKASPKNAKILTQAHGILKAILKRAMKKGDEETVVLFGCTTKESPQPKMSKAEALARSIWEKSMKGIPQSLKKWQAELQVKLDKRAEDDNSSRSTTVYAQYHNGKVTLSEGVKPRGRGHHSQAPLNVNSNLGNVTNILLSGILDSMGD